MPARRRPSAQSPSSRKTATPRPKAAELARDLLGLPTALDDPVSALSLTQADVPARDGFALFDHEHVAPLHVLQHALLRDEQAFDGLAPAGSQKKMFAHSLSRILAIVYQAC